MAKAPILVLKIGGSVITQKKRKFAARIQRIDAIAREIKNFPRRMVLVHGAGSFAHISVSESGLQKGWRSFDQYHGFYDTHLGLLRLKQVLFSRFALKQIPVVPVWASSFVVCSSGRITSFHSSYLLRYVSYGFIPLIGGDLVPDVRDRIRVVSGDQLACRIAEELDVRKIVFGTDVDGVYTSDPKKDKTARVIRLMKQSDLAVRLSSLGPSQAPDVTMGMLGKLRECLRPLSKGIEVIVANFAKPQLIREILRADYRHCTRIIPD